MIAANTHNAVKVVTAHSTIAVEPHQRVIVLLISLCDNKISHKMLQLPGPCFLSARQSQQLQPEMAITRVTVSMTCQSCDCDRDRDRGPGISSDTPHLTQLRNH